MIKVIAVEGRVAFSSPSGGKLIPSDKPTTLARTAWIDRLMKVHGDIKLYKEPKAEVSKPSENKRSEQEKSLNKEGNN